MLYIPEARQRRAFYQPPPLSCPANCSRIGRAGNQDSNTEAGTAGQSAALKPNLHLGLTAGPPRKLLKTYWLPIKNCQIPIRKLRLVDSHD